MDVIVERTAALSMHKSQEGACVRPPAPAGARLTEAHQFSVTVSGLLVIHDWLTTQGGRDVAAEASCAYWTPMHTLLLGSILAHLDFRDEQVEHLTDTIKGQLLPFGACWAIAAQYPRR